jgi:hypothetical protein
MSIKINVRIVAFLSESMSAKEQRAMQLEMHRMNRSTSDALSKNRELEAECARLRSIIQHEAEKHAAMVDAASKQHAAHQVAMERMKQEFAITMARMEEAPQRARQEADAQSKQYAMQCRQSLFDETIAIKRQLNNQYAEFIASKNKELDAAKQAFEERLADEKKANKQREEEQLVQFVNRMDEFNKLKAETMRQFEEANARMEQEHKQQLVAQDQREDEVKRQCRLRIDEAHRFNAEIVQKFEDTKRRMEEDYKQQLAVRDQREEEVKRQCMIRIDEVKRMNEDARRRMEHDHKQQLAARDQHEEEIKMQCKVRIEETNKLAADAVQKFDDARRRMEQDYKHKLAARDQREEETMRQFKIDETNRLNAETAQKLEDARRRMEKEHKQQLAAREEEVKQQCMIRIDEANRLNAETVQKLEDAMRRMEEDFKQQLVAEKNKLETQMHKCATLNDTIRKLDKERPELITLAETKFETYVQTHAAQLIKTISSFQICHAIAANYAHMRMVCSDVDFNGKRVLIYSHYSKQNLVESYNYLTLEKMDPLFDYVFLLTNCPNQWQFDSPNYNKYHVLWYNLKSDFRNYGVFLAQAGQRLKAASRLCITNDSYVIVDVSAFERGMTRMVASLSTHDFAGLTSSYENGYHLQSYFMCFNTATLDAVVEFFKTHGLPINHHDAISIYELKITKHLMDRGFKPFAIVSNKEMPIPFNTTCFKWSAVLQNTGIVKRQHFLKQYPPHVAMTDINIELIANKFSENKHFTQFFRDHGINTDHKIRLLYNN